MVPLTIASIAIPAIASIIGGKKKQRAERQAAEQTRVAEEAAIARQEPFRQAGISALERYQTLLGIEPTAPAVQAPVQARSPSTAPLSGTLTNDEARMIRDAAVAEQGGGELDNYKFQQSVEKASQELLRKKQGGGAQQQQAPQVAAPRKQTATDILSIIKNTPGYQFAQQQGEQAAIRAASATGFGGSGNLATELVDRSSQLAQGTFQDYLTNLRSLIQDGQQAAQGQVGSMQNIGTAQAGSTRRRAEIGSELLGDLTQIGGYAAGQFKSPAGAVSSTSLSGGKLNLSQFSN